MFGSELEEGEIVDPSDSNVFENYTREDMDMDITDKSESILIVRNQSARLHLLGTQRQPLIKDVPVSCDFKRMQPKSNSILSQDECQTAFRSRPSRRRQPLLSRDDVDNDVARTASCTNSATTNEASTKCRMSIQSKGHSGTRQQVCDVDTFESDDDLSLFLLRIQLLKSLNRKEKMTSEKESSSSACSVQARSCQKHSRRTRKRKADVGSSLMEQPEKRHSHKRSDDTENRFSRRCKQSGSFARKRAFQKCAYSSRLVELEPARYFSLRQYEEHLRILSFLPSQPNVSRRSETSSRPKLLPTPESSASELSSSKEEKKSIRYMERSSGAAASHRQRDRSASSEHDLNSEEHELRQYLIASMLEKRRQKALLNQRFSSTGVVDGTSDSAARHSKPKSAAFESGGKVEPTCSREAKKSDVSQNCATPSKPTTVPSVSKPSQQNSVIIPSVAKETPRRQVPTKSVPSSPATGASVHATPKQTIAQSHPLASFVRKESLPPGNRRYVRSSNAQENNSKGSHLQRVASFRGTSYNNSSNRNRYKWTQAKTTSTSLSNPVRPSLFQNRSYRKDAIYRDEAYAAFVQQKQKPVIVVLDDADSSDEECKGGQPPPPPPWEDQQPTTSKESIESAVIAQAEKDASEALLAVFDSRVDTAGKELLFYEKKIEEDKRQLHALHRQQNEEELYYRKSLNLRAKLQKELEKLNEQIEQHKLTMEATNKKIRVLQEVIEKGSVQKRLTELKWKSVKCASTAYRIRGGHGEQPAVDSVSAQGEERAQNVLDTCMPPQSSLTAEEKLMVRIRESLSFSSTKQQQTTFIGKSTPLMWFKSFRLLPAVMTARRIPLSSPALSNNIDPMVVFCPYALNGSCTNDNCPWQHPSDCQLSQKEILFDLLSYHPEAVIDANGEDSEVCNRLELYCKQLCQSFGQTETTDDLMKFCVTRMKNFLPSTGVCFEKRRFACRRSKRTAMKRWIGMTPFTDKSHAGSVSLCQIEDVSHILNKTAQLRRHLWDCIAQTRRLKSLLIKQGNCPKLWRQFVTALSDIIPNKRVLSHMCREGLRLAPDFDTLLACFVGCANFDEAFYTLRRCLLWLQQASSVAQDLISGRIPVAVANFMRTAIQLECINDALRVLESEILCSSSVIPKLDEESAVTIWLMLIHVRLTSCLPNSVNICQRDSIHSSDIVMPWTFLVKKHASLLFELLYFAGSRLGSHNDVEEHSEPLRRIYEPLLLLLAETSAKERLTFWIRVSARTLRQDKEFIAFLLFEPKFDALNDLTVRQEVVQGCLKMYPQDFRFNYYWLTLLAKSQKWGDIIDFVAPLNGYMDGIFCSNGDQPSLVTQLRSAIANLKAVADQLGTHWEAYLLLAMLLKRISVAEDVSLLEKAFDEDMIDLLLSPTERLCFLRELVELMRIFKVGQHLLPAIFRAVLLTLGRHTEQICLGSLPKMMIRALIDFVSEVMPNQRDSILKEMLFRFGEEQTIFFRLIDSLDANSPLWCHLVQSSAHKLLTIERYLTCIQKADQKDNRLLALFVLKHGLQAFPTCPELVSQVLRMANTEAREGFCASLTLDELLEISRCFHCDMLADEDRMEKYAQSIERLLLTLKASNKPTHVVDIGTGTGFLAMITARYSPDQITACEACVPVARLARSVISQNGLQDKVNIIAKSSWDLNAGDIGGRADVAVAEIFDTELIGEGALRTFALAHKNLLKPNCHVLPSKASVFVRAIDSAYIRSWFQLDPSILESFGIQIPCLYTHCSMGPQAMNVHFSAIPKDSYTFVTDKFLIFQFDFNKAQSIELHECKTVRVPLLNPGEKRSIDALLLWLSKGNFDYFPFVRVLIAPFLNAKSREHWLQALYGVRISLSSTDTEFTLDVSHDEFNFSFSPICSCAIHRICSFSQMSKLNDRAHYERIVEHLKDFRGKTFAFFTDLSFLPLIALKHGCKKVISQLPPLKQLKYPSFPYFSALANGFTIGSDLVITDRKNCTIPEDVDCLFCDLSFQLAGQSWHALELWQTFCRFLAKSKSKRPRTIYPTLGRMCCVAVDLFDHWKFQTPKHSLRDIDFSFAIDVVQRAISRVDDKLQAAFMWEYSGMYMSCPMVLCEVTTTNMAESINLKRNISLKRVGTVNAILFWTSWFCNDGVELTGSPFENVVQPGGSIRLDRSTKFGIHYLREPAHILTLPASLNLHFQLDHLRSFVSCKMPTPSMDN